MTVSVPVACVPESESVALTQYAVVEVGTTTALDSGVPLHALPEYQVYTNPVLEPPDAVALRVVDCPLSIVAEDGVTVITGFTVIADVVAVPVPPTVSVTVTVNSQADVAPDGVYVSVDVDAPLKDPGHDALVAIAHE